METGKIIRGGAKLTFDAVEGVTNIVEGMYRNIAAKPWPLGQAPEGNAAGIAGFVHEAIRRVNGSLRTASELALEPLSEQLDQVAPAGPAREAVVAAMNGVFGDHLERSGNPLALKMGFRLPLDGELQPFNAAIPAAAVNGKILVLAHGLCMNDRQWTHKEHNHGQLLAEQAGFTPVFLRYNSGRHISENGRDFAEQLSELVAAWPVPITSITLLGHSMGGLISRSAMQLAARDGLDWLSLVDKAVYLGSPHHGAVLERHGNWLHTVIGVSPYTAPLAALGAIRSAGVTDLRHGNIQAADWQDDDRFARHDDTRQASPLTAGVSHYALAASMSQQRGERIGHLLGDGLVHPSSATGRHSNAAHHLAFDEDKICICYGVNHMELLSHPAVRQQLLDWLA